MKLTNEQINIRKEIIIEGAKIASLYESMLKTINEAPSEKKALQGFKKISQTFEVCERQIHLSIGKLN